MTILDHIINSLTRLFAKTHHTMNPALLAAIVSLIEEAVTLAPGVIDDFKLIFNNPSPTPADWEALRAKVLAKSYEDYVPASALPAASAETIQAQPQVQPATQAAPAVPAAPANVVALSTPVPPPPNAPPLAAEPAIANGSVDPNYKPAS